MKADSVRTIFYALGANLAIAVAKSGAATRAEFPEIQWLFFEPDDTD